MVGKSTAECLSIIEANLAAMKSQMGEAEPDEDDAGGMEMAERSVGRGRKRRPAPFFKKKADSMDSEEESE